MKTCHECGQEGLKATRGNWAYASSGLKDVELANVLVYTCQRCGDASVEIPRPDELHGLLAALLAVRPIPLQPAERRFLRSYVGLSRDAMAEQVRTVMGEELPYDEAGEVDPRIERLLQALVFAGRRVSGYEMGAEAAATPARPEGARVRYTVRRRQWEASPLRASA